MIEIIPVWTTTEAALLALRATLVIALTWSAAVVARRRSAAERHFIWLIGMVGAVLLPGLAVIPWRWDVPVPMVQAPLFLDRSSEASPPPPSPRSEVGREARPIFREPAQQFVPDATSSPERSATTPVGVSPERIGIEPPAVPASGELARLDPAAAAETRPPPSWPSLILLVWAAVATSLLVRTAAGHFQALRQVRRADNIHAPGVVSLCRRIESELGARPVRILAGASNEMPKAAGLLRPWLVLPPEVTEWPRSRQDSVLRHEIAHVRRRDTLWEIVVRVVCALYWFNPLVWFAAARLRAEREHACDDIVLLSGTAPSDYASDLLTVARQFRSGGFAASVAIAMAKPSRLRLRLVAVLEDRPRTRSVFGGRGALVAAAGLSVMVMTGMASPAGPARPITVEEAAADVASEVMPLEKGIHADSGRGASPSPAAFGLSAIEPVAAAPESEMVNAVGEETGDLPDPWQLVIDRSRAAAVSSFEGAIAEYSGTVRTYAPAMQTTYRVSASLSRSTEIAPMVPARIVAAVRGISFLEQMNVGWGGSVGQPQTLSVSFTFPDVTAFSTWQSSEAGRAFQAAVEDASVAGTVRSSLSTEPVP